MVRTGFCCITNEEGFILLKPPSHVEEVFSILVWSVSEYFSFPEFSVRLYSTVLQMLNRFTLCYLRNTTGIHYNVYRNGVKRSSV